MAEFGVWAGADGGSLGTMADHFLLSVEQRVRPQTLKQYSSILGLFCRALGPARQASTIGSEDMAQFLSYCQRERHNGGSALRSKANLLGKFFDWLVTTGRAEVNPCRGLVLPQRLPARVQPFPQDVLTRLIREVCAEALANPDRWLVLRDAILVLLLYGLGLRLGELRNLRWSDLQYSQAAGYYFVIRQEISKGAYSGGIAPVTDDMLRWLRRWAKTREHLLPPSVNPYVIVADDAKSPHGESGRPISDSAVQRRVKHLFQQYGLASPALGAVYPHRFRHSFAVSHLMDDNDLKTVSLLLRHRSPQTTLNTYSNFTDAQLAEKGRRHNPLNRVFGSQRFPQKDADRNGPDGPS